MSALEKATAQRIKDEKSVAEIRKELRLRESATAKTKPILPIAPSNILTDLNRSLGRTDQKPTSVTRTVQDVLNTVGQTAVTNPTTTQQGPKR